MNLRELSYQITKYWQNFPNIEVYIDTDGLRPLASIDYDEENSRIVMIPEAKRTTSEEI